MKSSHSRKPRRCSRCLRGLLFRLAAVAVGLAPFVLAEGTLTILDWGQPTYGDDPFVGFSAVHPLFVLGEDETRYEIPVSRRVFFRPESFAAKKGSNEFRIFCLGGSTVQGRPFAIETSFTTWLEFNLQAADPHRRWEVVNCGGVSYASYRLVPILKEVLGHEPDLIIVYTGHNEFLEDRTYRHIKYLPRAVAWPCQLVSRTRTYTLLHRGHLRLRGRSAQAVAEDRPILGAETDAMLEYRGGLDQYHRDDKWRRDVIEHFRYNLRRMVQMTRDARVPLLLVNPVCNLRDCPPFKAQHRDGLTPGELAQWESLCAEAGGHHGRDVREAVKLLQRAMAIDDQHAGIHYLLATCYDALAMTDQARRSYVQAKELDVCPLRILEPMNEAILDVARRTNTPVVDVRKLFAERSDAGIPGSFWLLDHVHPSIAGHRLIADELADELIHRELVDPVSNWRQGQNPKARQYLASLGDLYYAKGQERLETLRCWTQGKAEGVREEKPDAARTTTAVSEPRSNDPDSSGTAPE